MTEAAKQAASDVARGVSEEARSTVERGKAEAADAAERTSAALDETAANLAAEGQETLAEVASMLSGRLSGLAHLLENRSLDELANDARELAQRNPGLFVAGGVALGIALSRFFKASAPHQRSRSDYGGYGQRVESSSYRSEPGTAPSDAPGSGAGVGPYGTEAAVPPEARSASPQSSGSTSTTGGAAGSGGTRNPTGGGND